MEPSQLRWLKKVFCFLLMEKVGFRKVSVRFLEGFCSAVLTVDHKSPAFLFLYSSYVQTTRSLPKKKTSDNLKLHSMFISKLFYNLINSLRSRAKIRISHTNSYKFLKMSLLIYQAH